MVVKPMLLSDLQHHTVYQHTKGHGTGSSQCVQRLELCEIVKDASGKRGCADVIEQQACQIAESVEHARSEHNRIVAQAPVHSKACRQCTCMAREINSVSYSMVVSEPTHAGMAVSDSEEQSDRMLVGEV